ncbi:MAG: hypothetical protein LBH84_01815, partial [Prevotellaceae bacterium]|nr:hypothetical protein [Prevotellaceae bacterium]
MKKTALIIGMFLPLSGFARDAKEIVTKAENLLKGEKTSYSEMSMQIVRPKYTRTLDFKTW